MLEERHPNSSTTSFRTHIHANQRLCRFCDGLRTRPERRRMNNLVTFFIGLIIGIVFMGVWAGKFWVRSTMKRDQWKMWIRMAKRYGTPRFDPEEQSNYHVMVSLLRRGQACDYYWDCWRNGVRIPPPPPFELIFAQTNGSVVFATDQNTTNNTTNQ